MHNITKVNFQIFFSLYNRQPRFQMKVVAYNNIINSLNTLIELKTAQNTRLDDNNGKRDRERDHRNQSERESRNQSERESPNQSERESRNQSERESRNQSKRESRNQSEHHTSDSE